MGVSSGRTTTRSSCQNDQLALVATHQYTEAVLTVRYRLESVTGIPCLPS